MLDVVKKDDNGNCILGDEPKLIKSKIKFKGKNNRLVCDGRVVLKNSNIIFEGDNSIVFLSNNSHNYYLHISIFNNSVFFMDERTYMANTFVSVLSEEKNVFIGKNCMLAKGVYSRLADSHLIYDSQSMERINESKSIYVGDHVWIGQDALLLKGNKIGSGAIIGARAVVSNKIIPSNSSWGGVPVREIRKNVFYDSESVHRYTAAETAESMKYSDDLWIYKNEGEIISFDEIEQNLNNIDSVDEKIDFLISIKNNLSHNRFYIDYFDSSCVFSFIMAVYNTEMFVEEAINSIIDQSIGFEENIQLILINDGSTDGSLDILYKYQSKFPNNITVINQENQGVAAARNNGLNYVKGNFVNFMDSDDRISPNTCEEVLKFFNANYDSVDVVALPVIFFGRIGGQHVLNYKFDETRVIDLTEEPNNPQLSAASCFIKYDAIRNIRFPKLLLSEDSNFVNKVLVKKENLGVITQAKYHYRKHGNFASSLDNAASNVRFFNERLKNHFLNLIDYCLEYKGHVPKFIQYTLIYDLYYLFTDMDLEVYENHIDKEDFDSDLDKIFEYIDIDVIWGNKNIKSALVRKFFRYFKFKEMHVNPKEGTKLISGKKQLDKLSIHVFWLDIVEIRNGYFNISGYLNSLFNSDYISISAVIKNSDGNVETILAKRVFYTARKNRTFLSMDWQYKYCFDLNIPLEDFENPIIKLCVNYHIDGNVSNFDEKNVVSHFLKVGFWKHARISEISNYIVKDNWIVYFENNEFNVIPYSYKSLVKREKIVRDLLNDEKPKDYISMLRLRLAYLLLYPIMRNKKIFLFMDRLDKSDDNAEHLFKYANQQKDGIKKYFVLSESSPDYSRVSKFGRVLEFNSFKHRLLYLFADKVISSHPDESLLSPFFPNDKNIDQRQYLNSLIGSGTYFLQHGVAYGNLSRWLKKFDKNLSLLLASSDFEREEFCNGGYGYDENIIQVLGLPRFDNLKNNPKNKIIIIPTWRNYLEGNKSLFENSTYFKALNDLMNNERLISLCNENNYEIIFRPHPRLNTIIPGGGDEKYLDLLEFNDYIKLSTEESYQDLFEKGSLLITDYSSVAFDFAYLKKPVIYYQPNDDYHHQKSYFDPETMGFGDVIKIESELVNKINFYLKNDCIMEDKYKDNVDKFFKYHDNHNCERVYDWIKKH